MDINCQVVNDLPAGYARKLVEWVNDVHSAADDQLLNIQSQVNHIDNMFSQGRLKIWSWKKWS